MKSNKENKASENPETGKSKAPFAGGKGMFGRGKGSRSRRALLAFTGLVLLLVCLNIISTRFFSRLDLTEDKRYSISPSTKEMLETLPDMVYVEVYLEGDLPAGLSGFRRLHNSIRETLEEFRAYGGDNLQFRFIEPGAGKNPKQRNEIFDQLARRGLQPTNVHANDGGKKVEKILFPGAIISYGGQETPVLLLKGNQGASPEQRLNQSVEGVEYELASAILRLTRKEKKRIGVIFGHGELNPYEFYDMGTTLKESYDLEKVDLPNKLSLEGYDAIIVAKPDSGFSEPDKYKIDQFIVRGGKALFFIDALNADLDSVGTDGALALPYNLNLDDLFFRYGIRLNKDLVMSVDCGFIPMVVGIVGDKPQTELMPWRLYPLINNFGKHPAVKNLDAVYMRFAGSIDTVSTAGITKTSLLMTGKYSRIMASPARLDFNEARTEPKPELYRRSNIPVAYLLEGSFRSLYENRLAPHSEKTFKFVAQDKPGKVLVVSDGDFVRNDINRRTGQNYPLGFDRFAQVQFANKDFVLNTLAYMLDADGLILSKAKSVILRPLDRPRLQEERLKWQVINLAAPPIVVILAGLLMVWLRKRRYTRFKIKA
ncbi:MAG: gliding motility-associated ABC transporter substrate-binding protein GldG [Bacteroidota bacterium]